MRTVDERGSNSLRGVQYSPFYGVLTVSGTSPSLHAYVIEIAHPQSAKAWRAILSARRYGRRTKRETRAGDGRFHRAPLPGQ